MREKRPEPPGELVPLSERSVIHVSPEEVAQRERRRGPFREVSLDSRMLRVTLLSGLMVAGALGVLALVGIFFGVF